MSQGIISRGCFLFIFLFCIGLISFGLYLEHVQALLPCPLCILQRFVYMFLACVAFIGLLHGPELFGFRVYHTVLGMGSLLGAGLAGRQVYLQHLPPQRLPECGPDLDYMLDVFPWQEVLPVILKGSGTCATVQWRFLGMSIPEWSLLCFSLFAIVSMCCVILARRLLCPKFAVAKGHRVEYG